MISKVTFFVLVASLAVSVLTNPLPLSSNQNLLRKVNSDAIDNLIDIAEQILLTLNMFVTEGFNVMTESIEAGRKGVQITGKVIVELAEQTIDKEVEILNALIERVKNHTSGERYDILQCIEDTENEAVLVRDQAINMSYVCIDSAIQKVFIDTEQIYWEMKTWDQDLKEEEKKLQNCKNSTEAVSCIKDVINRLGDIFATLPERVQAANDKAEAEMAALPDVIFQCADDSQSYYQREIERVRNDFNQCVSDRQSGSSSTVSA